MEGHQKLGGTIPLAPLVPTPMLLYTEEFYAHLHKRHKPILNVFCKPDELSDQDTRVTQ